MLRPRPRPLRAARRGAARRSRAAHLPTIWTEVGSWSVPKPDGTASAGWPVRLKGYWYEVQPWRVMPHFTPSTMTSSLAASCVDVERGARIGRRHDEVVALEQRLDLAEQHGARELGVAEVGQGELVAALHEGQRHRVHLVLPLRQVLRAGHREARLVEHAALVFDPVDLLGDLLDRRRPSPPRRRGRRACWRARRRRCADWRRARYSRCARRTGPRPRAWATAAAGGAAERPRILLARARSSRRA